MRGLLPPMPDALAHVEDRKREQKRESSNVGDVELGMFGNGSVCLFQSGRFCIQVNQFCECGVLHHHINSDGNGASPYKPKHEE